MAPTIAGGGDPARTMVRLWTIDDAGAEKRSVRGPKAAFDTASVVATALELSRGRRDGPVSLRALGAALGCTPMALYTYVGGKEELLDLMYDRVHAGFVPPVDGGVAAWAERLLAVYLEHPWAADVSYARPVLGPHEQAVLESLLAVLASLDLASADRLTIVTSTFALVRFTASTIADTRANAADDARWWAARAAALQEAVPDFAARYPHTAALAAATPAPPPAEAGMPLLEARARAALGRAVRLLVDGAAR
jgi:AcrR family transcriptional regulator